MGAYENLDLEESLDLIEDDPVLKKLEEIMEKVKEMNDGEN